MTISKFCFAFVVELGQFLIINALILSYAVKRNQLEIWLSKQLLMTVSGETCFDMK